MKIVIVGGGTSGWLAALIIKSVHKKHEITVVESSKIKTIGVGEGSTGFLRGVVNNEVNNYGCSEIEFMKYAKALPKLGVLFKNWIKDKEYIEPIDSAATPGYFASYPLLLAYVSKNIPIHLASRDGRMIEYGISSFVRDENYKTPVGTQNHAYHFDAGLAGEYFKSKCVNSVNVIDSEVVNIDLDEFGNVLSLDLANKEKVFGDFFIDASGFHRIFMEKMENEFIEYKDLTLNSAMPFRLDLSEMSNENFVTTAWAQKYGWMWMIPKSDHIGCGYIYDDRYLSAEDAKSEIENVLGKEITVLNNIKFKAGRLKQFWKNNVVSIGLSSCFLEPLEATSIHGTISQINNFVHFYLRDTVEETISDISISEYNRQTEKMIENFKTFILLHYYNTRKDTEFWKKMNSNAEKNKEIKKISKIAKNRLLNDFDTDTNSVYGATPHHLFNWVLPGLDTFSSDTAQKELLVNTREALAKKEEQELCDYIESKNWISNKDFIKYLKE
jgi:tryptophan halogenase